MQVRGLHPPPPLLPPPDVDEPDPQVPPEHVRPDDVQSTHVPPPVPHIVLAVPP
jgi:hypothetical protein